MDLEVAGGQVVDQGRHGASLAKQGSVSLELAAVTDGLTIAISRCEDCFHLLPRPALPAAGHPLSALAWPACGSRRGR